MSEYQVCGPDQTGPSSEYKLKIIIYRHRLALLCELATSSVSLVACVLLLTVDQKMKYDEITFLLGEFGKYQKVLYFTVCVPAIFNAINVIIAVFTLAFPDYR